jgi:hypothetical protein
MSFTCLNYLYRDYSNYKQRGSITFSNPQKKSVGEIESILKKHMLDETWFLHHQWGLPDLHFESTDWETDHPYHEIESIILIESTEEHPLSTIEEFLEKVRKSNYSS